MAACRAADLFVLASRIARRLASPDAANATLFPTGVAPERAIFNQELWLPAHGEYISAGASLRCGHGDGGGAWRSSFPAANVTCHRASASQGDELLLLCQQQGAAALHAQRRVAAVRCAAPSLPNPAPPSRTARD